MPYFHTKHNRKDSPLKDFCQALMKYKHVDCPGNVLHNMDAPELAKRGDAANWNSSKLKFLSQYKFNIAFENSSIPGYITEKLMDAYLSNTVPIYFGSEGDVAPFPKESMICANDYPDFESLITRIKELDEDDDAYMAMLAANPLRNGMELNPLQMLKAFLQPVMEKTPTTFEKDPLMVSDATRLIRIGGKSTLSIRFEMFRIAIKALFAKYIQKDNSKRNKLGVEVLAKEIRFRRCPTISAKKALTNKAPIRKHSYSTRINAGFIYCNPDMGYINHQQIRNRKGAQGNVN